MENELNIAVQSSGQPTNKVRAASNVGGALAGVMAGVMTAFGGPAIMELMGEWGMSHPSTAALLVATVAALASWVAGKYGGQTAAFNVLDKPNIPLVAISSLPSGETKTNIEENKPV